MGTRSPPPFCGEDTSSGPPPSPAPQRGPLVGGHLPVQGHGVDDDGQLEDGRDHDDLSRPRLELAHVSEEDGGLRGEVDPDLLRGLPLRRLLEALVRGADHPSRKGHLTGPGVALPLRPPDEEDLLLVARAAEDDRDAGALLGDQPAGRSSLVSLGDKESRKLSLVKSTESPENLKIRFVASM